MILNPINSGSVGQLSAPVSYLVPPAHQNMVPKPMDVTAAPAKPPYLVPNKKPGFVAYPKYVGPRDPISGFPSPQTPVALTPTPIDTGKAPPKPPHLVPNKKPGFVAYPKYVGPRDPVSGYPVPVAPVILVPAKTGDYPVTPQLPQMTPAMKPGFIAYPDYRGRRDQITGFPMPSFSQAAGSGNPPAGQKFKAPPLKPGIKQFPDHAGPRNPNTGHPVTDKAELEKLPAVSIYHVEHTQNNLAIGIEAHVIGIAMPSFD